MLGKVHSFNPESVFQFIKDSVNQNYVLVSAIATLGDYPVNQVI